MEYDRKKALVNELMVEILTTVEVPEDVNRDVLSISK